MSWATSLYLQPSCFANFVLQFVKYMTSDSFADRIRSKIKDDIKQTSYDVQGIKIIPDDHGTAHLSVIDKDGNAVAVTSSINN